MLQSSPPSLTGATPVEGGTSWQAVVDASAGKVAAETGAAPTDSTAPVTTPPAAEGLPDATTPEAQAAAIPGTPVRRATLTDDVLSVLLAAGKEMLTLDQIQADVNATGPFTPLQFVEDELEGMIKAERVAFTFEGSVKRYGLTSRARAEIEAPGLVLDRRERLLLSLVRLTLSSATLDFEDVENAPVRPAHIAVGASAEELALDRDASLDEAALGKATALAEEDALALVRANVLTVIEMDEPDALPVDTEGDEDEDTDEEDENDENDDEEDSKASAAPASSDPPEAKVFTFALGMVDELFRVGARALAERSLPAKEAAPNLPGAEEAAAQVYGIFEQKLKSERLKTGDMEAERDRVKAELAILKGKWQRAARWLDTNGGGTDIDAIAAEPKQKTDPRIFEWSKRVRVTEAVKASILDELNLLDTQLGEIATAEELSKASFKEKKAKIATKTAELKSASRGYEYHWVKQAYREPDWQRKVVVVRSAETHDYGTPLDEEPIPTGAQAPLFTGVQAAPPAPVPPAVDPSIAPVLGGEPKPDFTPAPLPLPVEPAAPVAVVTTPEVSVPPAPVDAEAPAFTKKIEGAPAAEEEVDAPEDKPAPLALEVTAENFRRLLTDLYTRNPGGISERDEPIKFGESFCPGRSPSASVVSFVSRVSAMMVKEELLIEVEDSAAGGKLRWLATQTDPRRLSAEALAAAQAEASKAKPAHGMPGKAAAAATETAEAEATEKKKPGRPKGSKNKPKDPAAPAPAATKGKGGKGAKGASKK